MPGAGYVTISDPSAPNAATVDSTGALKVSGATTVSSGTVTANQGTANTVANAWPVKITDGTNSVPVIVSTRGNFFSVGEGSVTPGTSLSAVSALTTGTVVDFGSGSLAATFQLNVSGTVTAGAVTFLGSVDGTTFQNLGVAQLASSGVTAANPFTVTTNLNALFHYTGMAIRYFRADVTTGVTGGATVTVKIAAF